MYTFHKHTRTVTFTLVGLALVLFLISQYIHNKQSVYMSITKENILEQQELLQKLARTLDTSGADEVVKRVVVDCATEERIRFDALLGSLAQLSKSELSELDGLYGSCAYFFATQRSVTMMRLDREYNVLLDHLAVLATADPRAERMLDTERWEILLELERERTKLNTDLVLLQREIVKMLLEGAAATAPSVQTKVNEGQEIRGNLTFIDQQADRLRADLFDHESI